MTIIEINKENYPIIFADLIERYEDLLDKAIYNKEILKNGKFIFSNNSSNSNNYLLEFIAGSYLYKVLEDNLKVSINISNILVIEVRKSFNVILTITKAL